MKTAVNSVIWTTLVLLAFCLSLVQGATALQYDRPATSAGELWRLFTCHWTHWSGNHLLWSAGTFALLAIACFRIAPRRGLACVVASAVSVGLAVSVGTGLAQYRGLSGIDSALFAMLATICVMENLAARDLPRAAAFAALLLALAGKLAYECVTGRALFVHEGASNIHPVPIAHAAGAATGVLLALVTHKRPFSRAASLIRKMHCQPPLARG
jgi:rhomboid family GlyGly-CTERM serine protease